PLPPLPGPTHILPWGYRLQVEGVGARLVAALVIHFEPFRDLAPVEDFERESVRLYGDSIRPSADADHPIPPPIQVGILPALGGREVRRQVQQEAVNHLLRDVHDSLQPYAAGRPVGRWTPLCGERTRGRMPP